MPAPEHALIDRAVRCVACQAPTGGCGCHEVPEPDIEAVEKAQPDALWDEMRCRWPGLTPEEARRGAAIAAEILAGKIAEESAQAEAMADVLRRADGDDAAFRAEVAGAVQDWGEAEFREIAEGTGIPLDHIRTVMAAIQRGDPLP